MEISLQKVNLLLPAIADGQITLVDCREDDEWQFNRLPGARLMPLSRFGEFAVPEGPVIVYCHHGMRSLRATSYFRSRGNPQVWSMAGGIDGWSLEIDPQLPRY
ncbi:MAG: moeZ [Akkermansiaceae bacterium]|nr:moeZ [Akkermansiaceae bacterium]